MVDRFHPLSPLQIQFENAQVNSIEAGLATGWHWKIIWHFIVNIYQDTDWFHIKMATGNELISRNIIFKVHCQTLELETWMELLSLHELTKKWQKTAYLAEMGNWLSQIFVGRFRHRKGCLKTTWLCGLSRDEGFAFRPKQNLTMLTSSSTKSQTEAKLWLDRSYCMMRYSFVMLIRGRNI